MSPSLILLYVWTVLALAEHAPIEHLRQFPGHEETQREALARYGEIAADIVAVCEAMKSPNRSCASLLLAIGIGESGFNHDADRGPCFQGIDDQGKDWKGRCDGGLAASAWQAHAYGIDGGEPVTTRRLFADRRLAARVVLRAAWRSLKTCAHLPKSDRLAGLSGSCEPSAGHLASARARHKTWKQIHDWRIP